MSHWTISFFSKNKKADQNKIYDQVSLFLFFIIILTAFLIFPDYGYSWDQFFHVEYGKAIIRWYSSNFSDTSAITGEGIAYNIMYYGGIFDVLGTTFSKIVPILNDYTARRVIILLSGLSGIFFCWKIGRVLYGPKLGLLCLLSVVTIPMYYGHMFFNPKDIPFAATYICSLYLIIKILLDLPSIKKKNIILLSCAIGVATGIRISGLVLIIYFAFALILYKLLNKKITHGENNKKLSALKITVIVTFISLVSLAITMIGWPYLFINPLRIFEVSNYAANFNGMKNEYVFSYIWNRFNFQLPELHIVLLYLSLLFMTDKAYSLYKNKFKMPKDTFLTILSTFIIILSITFPLLVIILKSTPLYNELRQILFIIPPLSCLLALTFYVLLSEYRYLQYSVAAFFSIALITSLHLTPENMLLRLTVIVLLTFVFSFILKSINLKNVKWLIIIVALLSLYQSTRVMFSLHPYEYTYYNKFIGGLNGAMSNGYDADYWLINYKETLDKFKTYIDKKHPEMKTVKIGCCTMPVNIKPYLGNKLILENNPDKMDFFIFTEKAYGCHPKDYFRDAKLVIETKRDDVRLGGIFDVRATKNRLLPNDYRTQRGKLDLRIRTLSTNDSNLDYSLDAWTVLDKRLSIPSFNFPLSSSLYNQDVGFFPLLYYNSFVLDMNSVLVVKKAGFYKIHISADNGVRLSLNGKIISELQTIKQFSPTSSLYNSKETETFLDKGKYHLNILYTHIPEALIKIVVKYKRSNQQKYFMIGENSEDISFVSDN